MEEFLQYLDRPLRSRVPESEDWPTSLQGLIQASVEEYLAHRPLKTRTGTDLSRRPKPKVKPKQRKEENA